jgi:hypothetical protein
VRIVLLILFPFCLRAQTGPFGFYDNKDKNQFYAICALQLVSGAARGYEQVVNYHYSSFKRVHPGANDQFFDPEISWKNKYKDGIESEGSAFPLSTTLLVWTTDFKHLMDFTSDVPNYICITIPLFIKHGTPSIKQILLRALTIVAAREIGFNTIYSVIYK